MNNVESQEEHLIGRTPGRGANATTRETKRPLKVCCYWNTKVQRALHVRHTKEHRSGIQHPPVLRAMVRRSIKMRVSESVRVTGFGVAASLDSNICTYQFDSADEVDAPFSSSGGAVGPMLRRSCTKCRTICSSAWHVTFL